MSRASQDEAWKCQFHPCCVAAWERHHAGDFVAADRLFVTVCEPYTDADFQIQWARSLRYRGEFQAALNLLHEVTAQGTAFVIARQLELLYTEAAACYRFLENWELHWSHAQKALAIHYRSNPISQLPLKLLVEFTVALERHEDADYDNLMAHSPSQGEVPFEEQEGFSDWKLMNAELAWINARYVPALEETLAAGEIAYRDGNFHLSQRIADVGAARCLERSDFLMAIQFFGLAYEAAISLGKSEKVDEYRSWMNRLTTALTMLNSNPQMN